MAPFQKGIFVSELLSKSHLLLFNKFSLNRNHLLVVTQKFEKQNTILTTEDLAATYFTVTAMGGVGVYDSSWESGNTGCTHRHIQVFDLKESFEVVKQNHQRISEAVFFADEDYIKFPGFKGYRHWVYRFGQFDAEAEEFSEFIDREVYRKGYVELAKRLGVFSEIGKFFSITEIRIDFQKCEEMSKSVRSSGRSEISCRIPHNIIMGETFIMVILRNRDYTDWIGKYGMNG